MISSSFPPGKLARRIFLPALMLAALTACSPFARAATEVLDSILAIVEDDIIMASELRARVAQVTKTLQTQGRTDIDPGALVRETLDRLVLEGIQLGIGRRNDVSISEAQIDDALNRLAASNRMSGEQFREKLQQEGMTSRKMRENIQRELILQRVQAGNVNQRIQVTPQEIDNFLESDEGQTVNAEEFYLLHALLPVGEDVDHAVDLAAKNHVFSLYERIVAGETFAEVVDNSVGDFVFTGGDLGWRKSDELPSLFAAVAPTLAVAQTAEPIRSPSGYHLIYLVEKRGGTTMVQQTRVRHILLKPSEIRSAEETRQLAVEFREKVINGASFEALAREHSDDMGTAQEGGDLSWTNPGQMVPEFENAMDSTAIDQVSPPFRSQFGWHILQVLERRQQDVTDIVSRNRVADVLHRRKYTEELDAWLHKIRDEAFVDIK